MRACVGSFSMLCFSILFLQLFPLFFLSLSYVLLHLQSFKLCILLSHLIVGQLSPNFDELFIVACLMTKTHFFCNLMDHFSLKCSHVVNSYFSQYLSENFSIMFLYSCLLLDTSLLCWFFLFLFLFLFLFFLLVAVLRFATVLLFTFHVGFLIESFDLITGSHSKPNTLVSSKLFSTGNVSIFLDPLHQAMHVLISRRTFSITNQNQHPSCSSHRHVHPSPILQKTYPLLRITSHQ